MAISIVLLIRTKADWKRLLPKSFLITIGSFIGITLAAGVLFMTDFHRYFMIFHEIFFKNDLWLLDPDTDLLIRMLPEGFFFDMVARIGIILGGAMVLLLLGSVILLRITYKRVKI